ncbi:translation initiation factor IF-2-like, partial [Harpia harpyja]|uniref:translation initiation factor IF-2-like n=1 Tax=Harpia harpyja TaxID=202280 RepID=UPI0022B09083
MNGFLIFPGEPGPYPKRGPGCAKASARPSGGGRELSKSADSCSCGGGQGRSRKNRCAARRPRARGKATRGAQPLAPLRRRTGRAAGAPTPEPRWDPPPFPVLSPTFPSRCSAVPCCDLRAAPAEALSPGFCVRGRRLSPSGLSLRPAVPWETPRARLAAVLLEGRGSACREPGAHACPRALGSGGRRGAAAGAARAPGLRRRPRRALGAPSLRFPPRRGVRACCRGAPTRASGSLCRGEPAARAAGGGGRSPAAGRRVVLPAKAAPSGCGRGGGRAQPGPAQPGRAEASRASRAEPAEPT